MVGKTIYRVCNYGDIDKLQIVRETRTLFILNCKTRLRKSDLTELGGNKSYHNCYYKLNLTKKDMENYEKYKIIQKISFISNNIHLLNHTDKLNDVDLGIIDYLVKLIKEHQTV